MKTFSNSVRFFVCGIVMILGFQTFFMEGIVTPFHVAGSSMSPTLMGTHWNLNCPECHTNFCVAAKNNDDDLIDHSQRRLFGGQLLARGICPACGFAEVPVFADSLRFGHRLKIYRAALSCQTLRRWDVVVFRKPNDGQPAVKRIIAMPNETVQIQNGDIFINGKIAAKPYAVQRETRIPVHYCQWRQQNENELICLPIRFVPHFHGEKQSANNGTAALNPSLFGVTNQLCENQNQTQRAENVFCVDDLMLELDWTAENDEKNSSLQIQANTPTCSLTATFHRLQKNVTVENQQMKTDFPISSDAAKLWKIEISLFDGQCLIAVNGIVAAEIPMKENEYRNHQQNKM